MEGEETIYKYLIDLHYLLHATHVSIDNRHVDKLTDILINRLVC